MVGLSKKKSTRSLPPTSCLEQAVFMESWKSSSSENSEEGAVEEIEGSIKDEFAELRKQVHGESMMYRYTPSYLSKAMFEEPVDEYTVLREQLRALECTERNGALLKPDEMIFPERTFPHEVGLFLSRESRTRLVQRKPVSGGLSTAGIRLVSGVHWRPSVELRAALSGSRPPLGRSVYSAPGFAATASVARGGRPRILMADVRGKEAASRAVSPAAFAAAATEDARMYAAGQGVTVGTRGPQDTGQSFRTRFLTLKHLRKSSRSAARDRPPQQIHGKVPREATLQASEPATATDRVIPEISIRTVPAKIQTAEHFSRTARKVAAALSRTSSGSAVQVYLPCDRELQPFASSGTSTDSAAAAEELVALWREAPSHGDATVSAARFHLVSDEGGEAHILNWRTWLQRQRDRGLYFTETLYLMTVFGAVISSRCLASLWLQLHTWETKYFFLGYGAVLIGAGLPLVHTEMLLGNLYRGSVVKCFTQINPHFVGLGLAIAFSNFLRLALRSAYATHWLLYFVASWQSPMPWELTTEDMNTCDAYKTAEECNNAQQGYLCSYSDKDAQCLPSPTGKAALYFLATHEPHLLGLSKPSVMLKGKYVFSVGLVWMLVLAHTWRGLFRLGFTSALLIFLGFLLSGTLVAVCLVEKSSTGILTNTARLAGEFRGGFKLDRLCDTISTSFTNVLTDLYVGCGVYQALSSYTKIGYNVVPGGNYAALVQVCMSAAALVTILGILGSVQSDTGIPIPDLVIKTHRVPAQFSVYPAGFVNISATNVFSMFLYGGTFLLDTQTVAILFHTFLAVFQECRIANPRWHGALTIGLVLMLFLSSLLVCTETHIAADSLLLTASTRIVLPLVVLLESVVVGWYLNYKVQVRVAGRRATTLYALLCAMCLLGLCGLEAGGYDYICWVTAAAPLINALLAAVVAFFCKPHRLSVHPFSARCYSLYLGNLDRFVKEVQRTTLYRGRFSWNFVEWIASLVRGIFWCKPCAPPAFFWRISLFWACSIKHIVPLLAAHAVSQGIGGFSDMSKTVGLGYDARVTGIIIVTTGVLLTFVVPFLPKVGRWVCPPAEDYMPIKAFPSHPLVQRKTESLPKRFRKVVLEFLWPETRHSLFVDGFLQAARREESIVPWVPLRTQWSATEDVTSYVSPKGSVALTTARQRRTFTTLSKAHAHKHNDRLLPVHAYARSLKQEEGDSGEKKSRENRKNDTVATRRPKEAVQDVVAAAADPAGAAESGISRDLTPAEAAIAPGTAAAAGAPTTAETATAAEARARVAQAKRRA